jgi:hypothetical protein
MTRYKHLIIVPGHACFRKSVKSVPQNPSSDDPWILLPFQKGEPAYYVAHIKKGIQLLQKDNDACLLFSGGRTREGSGGWSESSSYLAVARHYHFWVKQSASVKTLISRIGCETYAADSFQNLLFSLLHYCHQFQTPPEHISVVGWRFKTKRFDFHRQTLGIPKEQFSYIGCRNPINLAEARQNEAIACSQFKADPWGSHSLLFDKRRSRNPRHDRYPELDSLSLQSLLMAWQSDQTSTQTAMHSMLSEF